MTEKLLTVEQINNKIAELENLKQDLAKKENIRKQVEELIRAENYSLEDIFPELGKPAPATASTKKSPKRKSAGEPMYVSKTNPNDTYGGRGPLPKWLKEFEAAGGSREELKNPNY